MAMGLRVAEIRTVRNTGHMRGQLRPKGPSNAKPDLIARIIRPLLPPRNSLVDIIQQVVLVMYAELGGVHVGDAGLDRAVGYFERLSEVRGCSASTVSPSRTFTAPASWAASAARSSCSPTPTAPSRASRSWSRTRRPSSAARPSRSCPKCKPSCSLHDDFARTDKCMRRFGV